jgi:protein-S-isoprenylcysteine O-methyltransferase Ste14
MPVTKLLVLLTILTVIYQMYSYAVTRQREEKQRVCRGLGIVLFSIGAALLATRDTFYVFSGIFLMMLGFRLIAHGLDRIDKKIFIDRYDEESSDD